MAGLGGDWQMQRPNGSASRLDPGGRDSYEYMPLLAQEQGEARGGAQNPFDSRGDNDFNSGGAGSTGYLDRMGLGGRGQAPMDGQGQPSSSRFSGLASFGSNAGGPYPGGQGAYPGGQMGNGGPMGNGVADPRAQQQGHPEQQQEPPPGGPSSTGPDIVQFSAMFFYVVEGTEKVAVTAMRIGSLTTPATIEFRTEDNSAKAGLKYKDTKGKIEFLPGEEMKCVEIGILADDSFDTNLDFKVVMSDPQGCQLGEHLHTCRIVIIDDDVFPTNKHRDQILREETEKIGVRLLIAFIRFAIQRIPMVGKRTFYTLFWDQLSNVNYLVGIWLNVYLVDVVLAVHKPESAEHLWIKHQRVWTLVLVALSFIVPKAMLDYVNWEKMGRLAVGGKVKCHMKVNLFRKYLYYTQGSHTKVSAQELNKAMEGDINELVLHGFMAIFQISQQSVKVLVILCFLIKKRPSCALPLLIYPLAMAIVLNLRYEMTLHLKDKLRDAEKSTMVCLRESCDGIDLIKEYNMRTAVVSRYEKSVQAQGPPNDNLGHYDFRTMLVMPWITNVAIALFMIIGGNFVIQDNLSLGAYLATIGIYKDAGELFTGFYTHLKDFYGVIGPLLRVVRLLNLDTDVHPSKEQAEERAQGMLTELKAEEKMRKQFALSPRATSRFDMLHMKFVHASLANDRGGPSAPALQDISVEVPQGKMIAILGHHGSGKFSVLKLLTGLIRPNNGEVHVPTHLRCLCVPNRPEIFANGGLLENLTFGTQGKFDKQRLIKLCGAVGLGEHTMKILEQEMKEDREEKAKAYNKSDAIPWYDQLSQSELLKMHITRALNLNPEILLLHRPVDEMEADHAARLLDVMRQNVDHRGLFLTPQQRAAARPHTIFFTSGEDRERAESAKDVADVVWHTHTEKGFSVEQGGRNSANTVREGRGDNKIVNSWSREVRSLQVNLEKEKHLHTATLEDLEGHRTEVDSLRSQLDQSQGTLADVSAQAKRALRDAKSYESELAAWEGEQQKNSWLPCVERGAAPAPRQLSQTLSQLISTGDGRKDQMRARSQSPPAYRQGR